MNANAQNVLSVPSGHYSTERILAGNVFTLSAQYHTSIPALLKRGACDQTDPVRHDACPPSASRPRLVNARLVSFEEYVLIPKDPRELYVRRGEWPADIWMLLALGQMNPLVQKHVPIIVTGTALIREGFRVLPCLRWVGRHQDLPLPRRPVAERRTSFEFLPEIYGFPSCFRHLVGVGLVHEGDSHAQT